MITAHIFVEGVAEVYLVTKLLELYSTKPYTTKILAFSGTSGTRKAINEHTAKFKSLEIHNSSAIISWTIICSANDSSVIKDIQENSVILHTSAKVLGLRDIYPQPPSTISQLRSQWASAGLTHPNLHIEFSIHELESWFYFILLSDLKKGYYNAYNTAKLKALERKQHKVLEKKHHTFLNLTKLDDPSDYLKLTNAAKIFYQLLELAHITPASKCHACFAKLQPYITHSKVLNCSKGIPELDSFIQHIRAV
jgi:hypothetical protein